MEITFADAELKRLATDVSYLGKWSPHVIKKYRTVLIRMQAMSSRQSLSKWKGLHFERLTGKRRKVRKKKWENEYSVRLPGKWRLVFTFEGPETEETVLIIAIEDYH